MAKEYVPIFFGWTEDTKDLSREDKGDLIDAAVDYASGKRTEEEIVQNLSGMARVAFRFMKGQIDRNSAISDSRSKAGSSKREQDETNDIKCNQNESNSPKEKEKEEEKENKKQERDQKQKTKDRFDRFYAGYPRKEAKQDAFKAFCSLNPDDELLQRMIDAVAKQKQTEQWTKSGGQYIPLPASWIRGKRWEDEIGITTLGSPGGKAVIAQSYEQREYIGSQDDARKRLLEMAARAGA